MRRSIATATIAGIVVAILPLWSYPVNAASSTLPSRSQIIAMLKLANDHFLAKRPDPCSSCLPGNRPSNIWTRAVYYEGALAYARASGDTATVNNAVRWSTFHQWNFRNGATTTNADDQCAGQSYIELYRLDGKPERLASVRTCLDNMTKSASVNYWTWIDAIQMAMPVFAKMTNIDTSSAYRTRMHSLYRFPAVTLGLYNEADHLWWRDTTFKRSKTPAGKNVYWSRGNGWVFAALARVLAELPQTDANRTGYLTCFRDMASAIKSVQRSDGFWNENLADPAHFGGPEVTGTGLFTFGMAWGVNNGVLDRSEYLPAITSAWNAIADSAIFADGSLGYVQGTGDSPGDNGSGVTNISPSRNMVPDFDDFGLGCVLLAGCETAKLADDPTSVVHQISNNLARAMNIPTEPIRRFSDGRNTSFANSTLFNLAGRNIGSSFATMGKAASSVGETRTAPGIVLIRIEGHR